MTQTPRKYRIWSFNSMLVILYLLFFAAQVNRQFYSVANFFVYSQATSAKPEPHRLQVRVKQAGTTKFHLSVDKRYFGKDLIKAQPAGERFVIVVTYTESPRPVPVYEEGLVTRSVSTACLRGPPADARSAIALPYV